jgi:hypothetical protein
MMKKEPRDRNGYWESELESLGIEPKRKNELNDTHEIAALVDNIKQVYYQDYETAYKESQDSRRTDLIT